MYARCFHSEQSRSMSLKVVLIFLVLLLMLALVVNITVYQYKILYNIITLLTKTSYLISILRVLRNEFSPFNSALVSVHPFLFPLNLNQMPQLRHVTPSLLNCRKKRNVRVLPRTVQVQEGLLFITFTFVFQR